MNSGTDFSSQRPPVRGTGPEARPSVEALVGADAPFEPLPPPEDARHWDRVKGRWVRDGVSIPPDPAGGTMPPEPFQVAPPQPSPPAVPDDHDAPVPIWGLVIVAAMFGVGLAMGLLFTMAK